MEFTVLGPVTAIVGEQQVHFGPTREGTLLAVLLVHANETVSTHRLIDELWPTSPPPGAAETLPKHLHHLRRLLTVDGHGAGSSVIETRRPGYRLCVERSALDAWCFEDSLHEALQRRDSNDHRGAAERLRDALGMWRGPAFQEFSDCRAATDEGVRLQELRFVALEARIECDLATGRAAVLVAELEALVAAHPLRENLSGLLMLALYNSGRQAEALRTYERLRRVLAEELGLQPGPELRAMEHALLTQTVEPIVPAETNSPHGAPVDPAVATKPAIATALVERLPTYTFLFSDLEHSTALWEARPSEMNAAVTEHDGLLREVLAAELAGIVSHALQPIGAARRGTAGRSAEIDVFASDANCRLG